MPRRARLDYPGAYHHVMGRGIDGETVFRSSVDKQDFLSRLKFIQEKFNLLIFAWCIMNNHYHLFVQTGKVSLADCMRSLLTGYAVNYNRRHKRKGYLFQNRYKSIVVDADEYFLSLVRYIHLNPVKARVVPLGGLKNYPWGGHGEVVGVNNVGLISRGEVLAYFGEKEARAIKSYQDFVAEGVGVDDSHFQGGGLIRSLGGWVEAIRRPVSKRELGDERVLGGGSFVEDVLDQCGQGKERSFDGVDDLLARICCCYGVEEEALLRTKCAQVREARSVFIFFSVQNLRMSVTEAGSLLGIGRAAASLAMSRGMAIEKEKGILKELMKCSIVTLNN